ncbi:superoxide dismutase family protein [Aquibacillus sp. 3ASR75-11]|uniref:Superoxide dismutase family protein n=1 Tax=Terrihalobacillus insolitus TaxID=2950438 RepID=A0A9X4AKB5_9BACI|nr:superoxide dismutase family protein [Terrihalobacillus insolitus]MDC3412386.1 superoxide dismutase family protein [Terrihalobacillus insolitus]MDC3422921.1 superoxide dismutase family protein [Terrihalobacillus insolitus]
MKWLLFSGIMGLLFFLGACEENSRSPIEVQMYNPAGDRIGTATLTEQSDGVNAKLSLEGLEPGFHGIHVHEKPLCEGPDFKSAGSHVNPENKEHGLMHPKGAHLGDLPNIEAGSDGTVNTELIISGATLMDGKNSILKDDGTSLVVHEKQDDGISQPAGESGARIGCGKIQVDNKGNVEPAPTDPTESNKEKE